MNTCEVCVEVFNKSTHTKVSCPFCELNCCRTCCQTYLLSSHKDPHCMKCKHEYNRAFVDSFCTKRFRNVDYKKHRENVLFEREVARLPETQPYASKVMESRSLQTSYVFMCELLRTVIRSPCDLEPRVREVLVETIRETIVNVAEHVRFLNYSPVSKESRVVVNRCPDVACKGFLFDDWKCGICRKQFCEACHEEKFDGHACNPDTAKTMKLLRKDTKPCPKCNVPIHKIDGCSQMWCTQCHVAFDWRTGYIETGRIHNPHYVQFFKKTREHSDIPCGGCPTYHELKRNKASMYLLDVRLKITNIERELLYRYGHLYEDNHHLRVRYLVGLMKDDEFKREIQKRDKANDKIRDIRDIYRMYVDTVSDALRRFILDPSQMEDIHEEIENITSYTNGVITDIRKRYVSRLPYNIILHNNR